ncbi:MAG: hypothetical protein HXS53_11060, partial [Theionarchaea archaeon]|nr:hypothetical protein [Theionarchaea archaeon]
VLVNKNNYVFAADNNMPAGSISAYEEMNKADDSISMQGKTGVSRIHLPTVSTEIAHELPRGEYRTPRRPHHRHWDVVNNFKGIKIKQRETMKTERVCIFPRKINPFHGTDVKDEPHGEESLSWNTQDKEFSTKFNIRLARL